MQSVRRHGHVVVRLVVLCVTKANEDLLAVGHRAAGDNESTLAGEPVHSKRIAWFCTWALRGPWFLLPLYVLRAPISCLVPRLGMIIVTNTKGSCGTLSHTFADRRKETLREAVPSHFPNLVSRHLYTLLCTDQHVGRHRTGTVEVDVVGSSKAAPKSIHHRVTILEREQALRRHHR